MTVDDPAPIPRLMLTPEEAAQALGLSRTRIFALLARGAIDSVLVGRSRRIPIAALERFVSGLQQEIHDTPSR